MQYRTLGKTGHGAPLPEEDVSRIRGEVPGNLASTTITKK